jgi:hypothetical protein
LGYGLRISQLLEGQLKMRRRLVSLVLPVFVLALSACSVLPQQDNVDFHADGHEYTTYEVAKAAGIEDASARRIAYYSQAPDKMFWTYAATPVAVWGLVYIPYRQRIMDTLHSLHGGVGDEVLCRRARLEKMIGNYPLAGTKAQPNWELGFLIHAFGDSYAHTYSNVLDGKLHAYGGFVGHGFAVSSPDTISKHPEKYEPYFHALCRALRKVAGTGTASCQKGPLVPVDLPDDLAAAYGKEIVWSQVNEFLIETKRALTAPVTPDCLPPAASAAR